MTRKSRDPTRTERQGTALTCRENGVRTCGPWAPVTVGSELAQERPHSQGFATGSPGTKNTAGPTFRLSGLWTETFPCLRTDPSCPEGSAGRSEARQTAGPRVENQPRTVHSRAPSGASRAEPRQRGMTSPEVLAGKWHVSEQDTEMGGRPSASAGGVPAVLRVGHGKSPAGACPRSSIRPGTACCGTAHRWRNGPCRGASGTPPCTPHQDQKSPRTVLSSTWTCGRRLA